MPDFRPDLTQALPYGGLRVGRLWLDQGFALELHPSQPPATDGAVIRLLALPFAVENDAGERRNFVPHEHDTLVPLFSLVGTHVTHASIKPAR